MRCKSILNNSPRYTTIIACYLTYRKFYNSRHQLVVMPLKKS
ncbi:metal resistance protein [Salmonella enterica]|nr:metal resistance protein [Salmonella enterica]